MKGVMTGLPKTTVLYIQLIIHRGWCLYILYSCIQLIYPPERFGVYTAYTLAYNSYTHQRGGYIKLYSLYSHQRELINNLYSGVEKSVEGYDFTGVQVK